MADSLPDQHNVTPCCFRMAGQFHPCNCPERTERWAYVPIRDDECVTMRLVPVASDERLDG